MKVHEEDYYRLLSRIGKSIDWKALHRAFDRRFDDWWKSFGTYVRRGLENANFVKGSKFPTEKWLEAGRKGFYSNLLGLFNVKMRGCVENWTSLPFGLNVIDSNFDATEYVLRAKRMIEEESLNVSLDAVFYVPIHAAALFVEVEKRTLLVEKCRNECKRRGLKKNQTVLRQTKFEIAEKIGMKPGSFSEFKSIESDVYHRISTLLAGIGYHKKRSNDE